MDTMRQFAWLVIKLEKKAKIMNRYDRNTITDLEHHMKKVTKHNKQESLEASPFLACNHKAARNPITIYSYGFL